MVFEHDFKKFPELTNKQIDEFGFESPHVQYTEDFMATVVKVVDGDTVHLATEDRDFTFPLRMLNIDAPEMSEGGEDARDYLAGLIQNEEVEIKININNRVGKFGRLLGRIISLGMDMGETMTRIGFAVPFGKKHEGEVPDINKTLAIKQWF